MLDIRQADIADASTILSLRHAAEDWLASLSIDQWPPREVPRAVIDRQVLRGEFSVGVLPRTQHIVAAMRLIWSDPTIWEDDEDACYVHGLVIDRSHTGSGLGSAMLHHALETARGSGVDRLRLDCAETNAGLRSYYRRNGFTEVGRRDFYDSQWFSVTLFEKDVRATHNMQT